jgi:predicted site-specific integrase-resolvase
MKLSTWAKKQGVSYKTAWRWFKDGKLPVDAQQMPSGTYRYVTDLSQLENGFYLLTITSQSQQNQAKIIVSK